MSFLSRRRHKAMARDAARMLDDISAKAMDVGLKSAAFISVARQPGRVFSTTEIDAAADAATACLIENYQAEYASIGLPQDMVDTLSKVFAQRCQPEIRRGLYCGLPVDLISSTDASQ